MAQIRNFSITQQGQTIRLKGDIFADQTAGGGLIKSFDLGFVTWFQSLPVGAQLEFAANNQQTIIDHQLGLWPVTNQSQGQPGGGGQSGGGQG